MLPELLDKVTRVVADNLNVEKLTIVDGGDGKGLSAFVRSITSSAVVMLEELKNATGIDVASIAKNDRRASKPQLPPKSGKSAADLG